MENMPQVVMIDTVDSYVKRQGDILGMYAFSLVPIIVGIIFVFAGSAFGFLSILVGVVSLFIVRGYSQNLKGMIFGVKK